jgi:NAD+ diphosphatase
MCALRANHKKPVSIMARFYIFQSGKILLREDGSGFPDTERDSCLGELLSDCGYVDREKRRGDRWGILDGEVPEGFVAAERRTIWPLFGEEAFWRVGKAFHVSDWTRTHKFCGACGGRTHLDEREWGMRCDSCGEIFFPVIAPAIIVAIEKDGKILMGHGANFPPGRFSVLAGFVEPGESLEECVRREVFEESGICIKNIRYFGSQPWPFPRSLMVGFTAEWESGEIQPDNREILEIAWFSAEDLPDIPQSISISRKLIDNFIEKHSQNTVDPKA